MDRIVQYIIRHWKAKFTGTSALEVRDVFDIEYKEAINIFAELKGQGIISVQEAKLGQPIKFKEIAVGEEIVKIPKDWEMVDTLIAFPKREILENKFEQDVKDYGFFTNRLHKGDSQIKHYFFKYDVLDKYFKYPERYHIYDDITGGTILTKDKYYFSLPESTRDSETITEIRYGKRRLKNNEIVIAVIVSDLSMLPYREQAYWFSFEIESPDFSKEDVEFEKYWQGNFEAKFVDKEDLLDNILKSIRNINRITGIKIFRNDLDNPYLKYHVVNNRWAYCNAHKELFKYIGPDSLNKKAIKYMLQKYFNVSESEVEMRDDQGKERGTWSLFIQFIKEISTINIEPFQRCRDSRVETSHKISEAKLEKNDFIQKFRSDCTGILEGLKRLESFLKKKIE